MSLAKAWDQFLDTNTSGTSCLGPLAGLEKQRVIYESTVKRLADSSATTLLLVSRPQLAALREAERTSKELRALGVGNLRLLGRLRDPAFTRILLVTLPEATPVHEAAALQEDLRRAHIEPFAWVINQSLLNSGSCDPLVQCREESEHRYLREVVEIQAARTAWLPWQPEEPTGPDALARLAASSLEPVLS